jgi:hypothetical protein
MSILSANCGMKRCISECRRSSCLAIGVLFTVLSLVISHSGRTGIDGPQQKKTDLSTTTDNHYLREIYFYPFVTEDSFLHEFDPDWIVKNATVNFPTIKEMSGISVIIYWSQLCPSIGQCNFGIIDHILDFWRKSGRKVVLCVATIGAPIEKDKGGAVEFVSATPDWVLAKTGTFLAESNNFIGAYRHWRGISNNPDYKFRFPRYDDPRFVNEVKRLVRALGRRYDGNPVISYMRIGTGKSGEDNPYGRVGTPWFTNRLWVGFSRQVANLYLADFRKTQLEFDIGWTGIVAAGAKTATPIQEGDRQMAQEFIDYLVAKKIFIAYNGIAPPPTKNVQMNATAANPAGNCDGHNSQPDDTTPATDAALYFQIAKLRDRGIPFGLEGNALTDPCMNVGRISSILEQYRPKRFIFFGDAAAIINFQREGLNDKNHYEIELLTRVLVASGGKAKFEEQRAQALPKIKEFAGEVERFVQERVVRGR